MRYLVDGYNLLHATGHLLGKVGPHGLERARQALLDRLAGYAQAEASGVTVVFDARNAPPRVSPEQDCRGVQVRYAVDREADELIEELIRADAAPRQLTVVSNDRRIREAARRRHCPVQDCLDFFDGLGKAPPAPAAGDAKPGRPETLSAQEVRDWLRAFGVEDEG